MCIIAIFDVIVSFCTIFFLLGVFAKTIELNVQHSTFQIQKAILHIFTMRIKHFVYNHFKNTEQEICYTENKKWNVCPGTRFALQRLPGMFFKMKN